MIDFTKFILLSALLLILASLTSLNRDDHDEDYDDEQLTGAHVSHAQVRQVAKSLFGKRKAKSVSSALKRLKILQNHAESEGIYLPMDVNKLLAFNDASEAKCLNLDYLHEMSDTLSSVKFCHQALTTYVEDCFKRQMAACDFTGSIIKSLDNYEKASGWIYLRELKRHAKRLGSRVTDPGPGQLKFRLSSSQLSGALELMSKSIKSDPKEIGLEMRAVCRQLFDHEHSLRISLKDSNLRGNKDAENLFKYLGLCQMLEGVF